MSGKSRIEKILENLLGENNVIEPPIGRDEKILYSILNDLEYTEPPHSIFEELLLAIKNGSPLETEYAYEYLTRDEKILFCKLNRLEYFEPPHSRLERLLIKWLYLDLYLNIDGIPPFTFISNGSPIIDYAIYGNTLQNGTPTPDNPIMPQGTGERTGNLWNEDYTGIDGNLKYVPVFVGEGTFTLSTNTPNYSGNAPLFLLSGNVTSGASTPVNGVYNGLSRTTDSSNGYITIAFRWQSESSDPTTHKTMLNSGSTALPYENFGYKIPISSANTTTPVYLGEVETTRKIRKVVFDGLENWRQSSDGNIYIVLSPNQSVARTRVLSTHFTSSQVQTNSNLLWFVNANVDFDTAEECKTYLAAQYAAGTPVTVWYVLATETTGIVNEPLMRIGDYADSISYEQTVVSIPTVSGRNTFDILGDVKPSNVEIAYAPRAPLLRMRKTILKK